MILIGLGANMPSVYGPPQATLEAALNELAAHGVTILRRSRFYRTAPVPASDQPWYVNAVASVETVLDPPDLLALLHRIEAEFGRERRERNEPRSLDLDLLAYHDRVQDSGAPPILPHPRLHERAFVLLPLAELAPDWRHPVLGTDVEGLIEALPPEQRAEPVE